jgi:PAS domain S-box-containing protein
MPTLKQKLSYIILGQKGGKKRIQIIDLLNDRPYNLHQLSEIMNVNYRTVQHHVDVLKKNGLVSSSKTGGSGEVYFLTQEMESNMVLYKDIVNRYSDFTSLPGFFQSLLEQTNDSVIIMDKKSEIYFWNKASEDIFGYNDEEVLGNSVRLFSDESIKDDLINKVINGEQIASYETLMTDNSGKVLDVSLTMDGVKNEANELVGFVLLTRDITERKQKEKELIKREEKLRTEFQSCCPEDLDDDGIPRKGCQPKNASSKKK